jgi:hypothetical protein
MTAMTSFDLGLNRNRFLKSTGAIDNEFLISLIFTLVNVCSTPLSFYTVEKFGRRPLLVWGALGMLVRTSASPRYRRPLFD